MSIYITTFEIVGDHRDIADRFQLQKVEARAAHWEFVEKVGGMGYRPSHNGGLRTVFFAGELPTGWRRIGAHNGNTEAVPHRGTKTGKLAAAEIAELPKIPEASTLAKAFGYCPETFRIGDGKIFFPTELRVSLPKERHFLRLPLETGDSFKPDPAMLAALPESEFMKAVEDHNRLVRHLNAGKPSAGDIQ